MERASGDITLYVTPEIVKNTDVHAEELQQGTSAGVITGRQEDTGEAPWKKAKMELLTKHGSSQNDPS